MPGPESNSLYKYLKCKADLLATISRYPQNYPQQNTFILRKMDGLNRFCILWHYNHKCKSLSVLSLLPWLSCYKRPDILNSPAGNSCREFDRLGESAGLNPSPPSATADRDNWRNAFRFIAQYLWQSHKPCVWKDIWVALHLFIPPSNRFHNNPPLIHFHSFKS